MALSSKQSVIPNEVQQLFEQMYVTALASGKVYGNSEQLEQLETENQQLRTQVAELSQVITKLSGILFTIDRSREQMLEFAKENEALKQKLNLGSDVVVPEKKGKEKTKDKDKDVDSVGLSASEMSKALRQELRSTSSKSSSTKSKSSTKAKTSSSGSSSTKKSEKKKTAEVEEATLNWEVGTEKTQPQLIKAGVISRTLGGKIKKVGSTAKGKDGSSWELVGVSRQHNNAKLYRRVK